MKALQTYDSDGVHCIIKDKLFSYQMQLTEKLDNLKDDFNQELINEIVLWKVNRYASLEDRHLQLINKIDPKAKELDEELTQEALSALLPLPGIRLPMVSTILRFRNPNIYQIIDQRVYRFLYGTHFKTQKANKAKQIEEDVNTYLDYLLELRNAAVHLGIKYSEADRILYNMDKRINKDYKIKY